MWSYVLRRILVAIPTLWITITLCYLLLHFTPGGPFDGSYHVSAAVLANLQAKYHLNEPLWKQYLMYFDGLLHGDLGASFRYADWSVNDLVKAALPVSFIIGGGSLLLAVIIGVALGIVAALNRNSVIDYFVMFIGNIGMALPAFIFGPILIMIFAVWLKWLPAGGWNDFEVKYMVLPMALLTILNVSSLARLVRGSMLEVLSNNYIRTAKAKGLPMRTIVLRHALKPSLVPVVTVLGLMAASSITSAVLTETVFSLPGIGKLTVNGASNRDYTLVLGLVVLTTLLTVLFNLLADLAYGFLDPKIRYS